MTQNPNNIIKKWTNNTRNSQLTYIQDWYDIELWDKHEYHYEGTNITRHKCELSTKE